MIFRETPWLYKEYAHFQLLNFLTWPRTCIKPRLSQNYIFYFLLPLGVEQRPLWKQQRKTLPTLFLNFSFLTLLVFLMQKYARSLFSSGLVFWYPKIVAVCERYFKLQCSVCKSDLTDSWFKKVDCLWRVLRQFRNFFRLLWEVWRKEGSGSKE